MTDDTSVRYIPPTDQQAFRFPHDKRFAMTLIIRRETAR